jgi:hypothetical protein
VGPGPGDDRGAAEGGLREANDSVDVWVRGAISYQTGGLAGFVDHDPVVGVSEMRASA